MQIINRAINYVNRLDTFVDAGVQKLAIPKTMHKLVQKMGNLFRGRECFGLALSLYTCRNGVKHSALAAGVYTARDSKLGF